jgi:hypothetical protein
LWRWRCSHLRQRLPRLRQPESHLHGAVQRDGSRQRGADLLPLARRGLQHAEAAVAVGLEWAQAEILGEGKGLTVVRFSGLIPRGITLASDLTEEP